MIETLMAATRVAAGWSDAGPGRSMLIMVTADGFEVEGKTSPAAGGQSRVARVRIGWAEFDGHPSLLPRAVHAVANQLAPGSVE